ncbi:MAG: DUF4783 domain-containing protein [Bacteroidales bacterium]|nr:DUF4783 domain-containing protein [Bacteroidales bacterium]
MGRIQRIRRVAAGLFCCCLCLPAVAQQDTVEVVAPSEGTMPDQVVTAPDAATPEKVLTPPASATPAKGSRPDFEAALKKSDIKVLANTFHATIELYMPEKKQASYAKAQAEQIIKKFLEDNKPSDCVQTHRFSREGEESTVSTLYTSKGNYRLSIRMRPIEGALRIFSIRIEEDND